MTFRPMLAVNADFGKIKYPVFASPKLDGIRASVVNGKALTRTLKDVPNHHIRTLLSSPEYDGLDGELIIGEPTAKDCYTQSVSGVMRHEGEPDFTYWVFDQHNNARSFGFRYAELLQRKAGARMKLLEQAELRSEEAMLAYEAARVEEGYEGIILRAPLAPYKYGRSTVNEGYLLKVKRFEDSEAEIIGFEEEMFNGNDAQTNELGRTKRSTARAGLVGKGTLGAFLVRDLTSGVEFSIGTGLTALQREAFWARQDDYLGKLVKYKFFPVGVKVAPRHPVFLGMRDVRDL